MNEMLIQGLRVKTRIGVPETERATEQELLVDLTVQPMMSFEDAMDDVARTVDYDHLSRRVAQLAGSRPRHLIETLAAEIAKMTLAEFSAQSVEVQIRKFILPQTDFVAVRCRRNR